MTLRRIAAQGNRLLRNRLLQNGSGQQSPQPDQPDHDDEDPQRRRREPAPVSGAEDPTDQRPDGDQPAAVQSMRSKATIV